MVVEVDGDEALVAWQSGTRTTMAVVDLRSGHPGLFSKEREGEAKMSKLDPRWVVVVEEHDQSGTFVSRVVGPFDTEGEADGHCLELIEKHGLGCAPNTHEMEWPE